MVTLTNHVYEIIGGYNVTVNENGEAYTDLDTAIAWEVDLSGNISLEDAKKLFIGSGFVEVTK